MHFSKQTLTISSILIVVLILLSTLMLFRDQIRLMIGDFLVVQDDLYPADVIHIIAGDDYRTEYAIQLYKQGYAKLLFFTGGWCTIHGYFHGEHGLEIALEAGIPREAVAYDDAQVLSTYDEALLLKKYLNENQPSYQSVMVVSDPFHMRRSQWTYRHILGKGFNIIVAPVPFNQTPYKQQWWTDEPSQRYVMDEYKKLVYYFFRYQLNLQWLAKYDKS